MALADINQIVIKFVDHKDQRYATCGDWVFDGENNLVITVSRTADARSAIAVAYHEFIEAILCTAAGITPQAVDDFDMDKGADYDEPGRHPSAPYHKQHIYATAMERRFIETLGVSWDDHDKAIDQLGKEK